MAIETLLPADAEHFYYEEKETKLHLWRVGLDIFITRIEGYGYVALLRHVAEFEKAISEGAKLRIFHDWELATDYDAGMRDEYIGWARVHLKHLHGITVFIQSSIVAIGVATGAIIFSALGLELRQFRKREAFEAALREAIANARPRPR